ncbi:L-lactate dehydrogenase [Halalkalibacter wakoensis JCM 9140]|uniref:Lactate utilization protein C n=1 Tax=Halalkalibacter wakoensis JCM 9140 TaxID=1236970 RepID=W4Q3Q0_9BACI|nr:lactate utilization protein C [Halalkalibacter wakoensis]GAE26711.1 L-lactate dehydrogenase [Halalkalibacter wakoensis JCM 9140]
MTNGTIQNQEAFLNKIASSLGRERRKEKVARPVWKKQPQHNVFKGESQDQLVDRLKLQCEKIHTSFEHVTTAELPEKLEEVIERFDGQKIVNWKDERFSQFGLDPKMVQLSNEGKEIHTWEPERGSENITLAEQADIGITFSDMTLAESGTVVLLSDENKGRSVSLLPTSYIAIIPKSTIVPRMTQAASHLHELAQKEGRFPSCVNFISGPSNSADIEMNLVVGVHGPIRACYIVVDDQ